MSIWSAIYLLILSERSLKSGKETSLYFVTSLFTSIDAALAKLLDKELLQSWAC